MARHTEVVVMPTNNRVVRYKKDAVGNDLTATLRWCGTHSEPLWEYDDGSTSDCPHALKVGWSPEPHIVTDGPWERPV